ncbi:hypothetical protein AB0P17_36090 [Streptomyces sp. NPDC088124]|uniref:hypothetical protein n=1 Tax=Streptomyces sp. NPDC088124 TaxID=3154654 RepID=UPI0034354EBE
MHTRTAMVAVVGAVLLAGIVGCTPEGAETVSKPAIDTPAYKIDRRDGSGSGRTIEIEVDSTEELRAVFHALSKVIGDAAYFVTINRSSGGTPTMDNHVADGRYARGTAARPA